MMTVLGPEPIIGTESIFLKTFVHTVLDYLLFACFETFKQKDIGH